MNNTEIAALLTAAELKEVLEQIWNGKRGWNDENESQLILSMLTHIGSTDSKLRDTYIYGMFCKLILEKQLAKELQKKLLAVALTEDMLFHGIEEKETDLVFTRSFTTLLIALVLYSDNESNFLSAETIKNVKEKMIVYLAAEKDLRGFVSGKGWAHSIAHAADVFEQLVKNRHTDAKMQAELLNELWKKAFIGESVYVHDEEERILIPILEMIKRRLNIENLENLLQDLPAEIHQQKEDLEEESYWFLMANAKKFLKSFYVQIDEEEDLSRLQENIKECLAKL